MQSSIRSDLHRKTMSSFNLAVLFLTLGLLCHQPNTHVSAEEQLSNSYEVWASDQSNSVTGEQSAGINGSYLWIWDSNSIKGQIKLGQGDAVPLSCTPNASAGPCDLWDVFPRTLQEISSNGVTGNTLGDLPKFGRLHGMIKDPQARYVTANMYAPGNDLYSVSFLLVLSGFLTLVFFYF